MIAQLWLTYVITKYLITKHDGSTRALTVTVYKYPTRVLCLTFPFLLVGPLNIIPFFAVCLSSLTASYVLMMMMMTNRH